MDPLERHLHAQSAARFIGGERCWSRRTLDLAMDPLERHLHAQSAARFIGGERCWSLFFRFFYSNTARPPTA